MLNYYSHRSGSESSRQCFYCNEPETMEQFFIEPRRLDVHRKRLLKGPLRQLGFVLKLPVILSLGAMTLGHCNRNVCDAIFHLVSETKRLPCYFYRFTFLNIKTKILTSNFKILQPEN